MKTDVTSTVQEMTTKRSSVWRLFIVTSAPESQQVMTQNALHTRTKFKPWKNSERLLRVYRVTCAVSGPQMETFVLPFKFKVKRCSV